MDFSITPPERQSLPRRRRVPLSDIAVHLVEQHDAVMKHLLFWMQDQTYYRQRWHRRLSHLPLFEPASLAALQRLLVEIDDALAQFPHGFDPSEEDRAARLNGRLRMFWYEVLHLKKLCGAYVARTAKQVECD